MEIKLKLIPTEDTLVKNRFINNISLNDTHSLFLILMDLYMQ